MELGGSAPRAEGSSHCPLQYQGCQLALSGSPHPQADQLGSSMGLPPGRHNLRPGLRTPILLLLGGSAWCLEGTPSRKMGGTRLMEEWLVSMWPGHMLASLPSSLSV